MAAVSESDEKKLQSESDTEEWEANPTSWPWSAQGMWEYLERT
jgi:hypothetical protein